MRFDERLSVPLWWAVPGLIVIGLIVLDVVLGHPTWPAWIPAVLLVPLLALAMARLGRSRVTLREDRHGQRVLQVGPARLPERFIAEVAVVPANDKQPVLGPELDPTAFLLHRPWIKPMVKVTLGDPDDPTPYWLFSVRRPEALVSCLRATHERGR